MVETYIEVLVAYTLSPSDMTVAKKAGDTLPDIGDALAANKFICSKPHRLSEGNTSSRDKYFSHGMPVPFSCLSGGC